jgi:hypothetical protein
MRNIHRKEVAPLNKAVFVIEEVFLTDEDDGRMHRFKELLENALSSDKTCRTGKQYGR